jgi:hypothetical protein
VENRRICEEFIIRTLDVSEMYDCWRRARDEGEDAESNVLIDYVRVVKILESMMSQHGDDRHKAMRGLIQQCKAENLFVDVMDYLIMECGDDMDSFYDYYDPEREAYYIRLETEAVVTERLTRQFEEKTEELRRKLEETEELRRKQEEEVRRNNVEKASHFISKGYDDKLVSEISDLPVEEVRRIRESQGKERANRSSHSLVLTRSISITDMSLT